MTVGPNVGVSWDSPNENVPQVITVDSILTGVTAGLTLQNTTAATFGAQVQRSPSLWQYGRGWDVNDAVSRVFGMGWQMRPVAGNTVTGGLTLMRDLDGVVADTWLSIASTGSLTFAHASVPMIGTLNAGTPANLFDWGVAGGNDILTIGSSGVSEIRFLNGGHSLRMRSTGTWTNLSGGAVSILPSSTSASGTGTTASLTGQILTGSAGNSTGGTGQVSGGNAQGTGAAFVFRGGPGIIAGGLATGSGGGGTYQGGDAVLMPGTGGTANGNTYIGSGYSAAFAWQAMANGIAIQVANVAPTGNPTGAFYLYMDPGDNALKARSPAGTITVVGAA